MEEEIWRPIEGYKGLYEISNLGRIRSLNYHRTSETRVLKAVKNRKGYLIVHLSKNGISKTYSVHRLVAEAFIPNSDPNKNCIDHIDTVRTNNYYKNLRWCTIAENNKNELTRKHRSESIKGENHPLYGKHHSEETKRKMSKQVEIFNDGVSLGIFFGARELERRSEDFFGIKLYHSSILDVCAGKKEKYKGFTFRYVQG